MATSAVPMIGAGTTLKAELDPVGNPLVFTQIIGLRALPAIGEVGSFVDVTAIEELTKAYIGGMTEGADWQLQFNDITADADQATFLAMVVAKDIILIEITFPNGRVGTLSLATNGYTMDPPDAENAIMFTVSGKQSGAVTWVIA